MAATCVLGSENPVETKVVSETSDRQAKIVTVEGPFSAIKDADPNEYCPDGFTVETSSISSGDDGLGVLTVRCVKYDDGSDFSSVRDTFRVDMQEVHIDLEDHPYLEDARDEIIKWLATDASKRVNESGSYKYEDAQGQLQDVEKELTKKFCAAYMAGIKSFNRYYPVIEKISIWKNPPGMTRSGRSFSGGNPKFSDNVGTYDSPPLSLNGFPDANWFKSKDSWVQNADTTWTRSEQWTYTPESSGGSNSWIYKEL